MMKKEDLKVGTILYSSWGYNCTRISFYRITKISEKSVWIQQIAKQYVNGTAPNYPCSDVIPRPDAVTNAPVLCRRIGKGYSGSDDVCIKVQEYETIFNVHKDGTIYGETCD